MGLQTPFTTVILKYWWGCSPSAPPIPTALNCNISKLFQGKTVNSYVALDQFEFLQTDACELHPPEAKPLTTPAPVTTTPKPTTTATEPPGRKFSVELYTMSNKSYST